MNLDRAKILMIALAALALVLIALASSFRSDILFMAGLAAFLLLMLVWFLFNRCPHCGRHLGDDTGAYCPHCGKRL